MKNSRASSLTSIAISQIWRRSSIPFHSSQTSIARKVEECKNKGCLLLKSRGRKENEANNRLKEYQSELFQLFNIAKCKCENLFRCICLAENKIPLQEHAFFLDQKGERKCFIGCVDAEFSRLTQHHSYRTDKNKASSVLTVPETITAKPSPSEKKHSFGNLALQCDRYKISDRAAVSLANAVLSDTGVDDSITRSLF